MCRGLDPVPPGLRRGRLRQAARDDGRHPVDRHGNQNISAIGDFAQPKRQLLGLRGAPGNTVNHRTSYWVPKHSPRVFVEQVDIVSGVGPSAPKAAGRRPRYNDIRRIVTNLARPRRRRPGDTMRLLSVHPGVTARRGAGGDRLRRWTSTRTTPPDEPAPTAEELILIREVLDPKGLRDKEVPTRAVTRRSSLRTPLTDLVGVRHPVVQTGMGWVSGPRLVTGTANAGGLGILAGATMTVAELEAGDPRGQEPHRPAVRRQPARRRRRRPRALRPAHQARRQGRVVRAGAQAGADRRSSRTTASW